MRHRRSGRKFNRDTKARKALLKSLAYSLVREGKVVTTQARAKELRRLADQLMTIGRGATIQARRELHEFFGKRDVANVIVDRLIPLNTGRSSGFTTMTTVGNRAGDNSLMVEVKWLVAPELVGTLKNPTPTKPAKTKSTSAKAKAVRPAAKVAKLKPAQKKAAVKKAATAKPAQTKTKQAAK